MASRWIAVVLAMALLVPSAACAEGEYPPRIDGARGETYKTVGDNTLKLWVFGAPTIIFHGHADETVPITTAEAFTALMRKAGNGCELVPAQGQPHGFFNREPWRSQTLGQTEAFLQSLGWIPAAAPASVR